MSSRRLWLLLAVGSAVAGAAAVARLTAPSRLPVAQGVDPLTPTPALIEPEYFFSLPGACPGRPLTEVPQGTSRLQLSIDWSAIPTTKAWFVLSGAARGAGAPTGSVSLLFEREGSEAFRCSVITLWVANSWDGVAEYGHGIYSVDDPNDLIPMQSNPEELGSWEFEPVATVQAAATAMHGFGQEAFQVGVGSVPRMYTRPDESFSDPPVSTFTTADTVYLMAPQPCVSLNPIFSVSGPNGFAWGDNPGMCRPYNDLALRIGTGLTGGTYVATVTDVNTGPTGVTWTFTVVP